MWNSILEPEDNTDDVEHFQDIPDSPTHESPHDSVEHQEAADAEAQAAGANEEEEVEDEEDGEGDMGPSTSGREGLPGVRGQMQGSAPAGALPTAPLAYDMRKRYSLFPAQQ